MECIFVQFVLSNCVLLASKEAYFFEFKQEIKTSLFINTFGRNNNNPQLFTIFYTHIISTDTFILEFLDKQNWTELWREFSPKDNMEMKAKLTADFYQYTDTMQKSFEKRSIFFMNLIIATKFVLMKIELNNLQQIAYDYYLPHPESTTTSHIITPKAHHLFKPINDLIVNLTNNTPNKIGCFLDFDGNTIKIKLLYVFKICDIQIPITTTLYKIQLK